MVAKVSTRHVDDKCITMLLNSFG